MQYINHRINTVAQLAEVPLENGIELDIRYHENELVLHHDPFGHHQTAPTLFTDLLAAWHHSGPMILNVKTEGIERLCINLMQEYGVKNWFFLDLSMPYFAIFSEHAARGDIAGFGPENLAVRFSEREPIEYALAFTGKARWVWVDCFTKLVLTKEVADTLEAAEFEICLVSPELQGHYINQIAEFKKALKDISLDAICTKYPDLW